MSKEILPNFSEIDKNALKDLGVWDVLLSYRDTTYWVENANNLFDVFNWEKTNEGADYWMIIIDYILEYRNLQILKNKIQKQLSTINENSDSNKVNVRKVVDYIKEEK